MIHTYIALRYLRGRKRFFIKGSNLLSMMGIFLGVFSLLVVASVMNGFDRDMRNRIIGAKSEIRIYKDDFSPFDNYNEIIALVEQEKKVVGVAPICDTELLLQNKKHISSAVCSGIDFLRQKTVNDVLDNMVIGEPDQEQLDNDGIIIGLDLSLTLNVTVGEYLQISSPIGTEPTPFGLLPKSKRFKVIGIFISGLPEFDKLYTYISLENAQFYQDLDNAIHQLEVKTESNRKTREIATQIEKNLGKGFNVQDWSEFDANLFNAIKMEKAVMYLVLILMLVIASFNMAGNFIKLVVEKKAEIGILKAIGASDKDIKRVFLRIGLLLGFGGVISGEFLALILLLLQKQYHLISIPVAGFPIHWLPVEIRWLDFISVPVIALVISYLTTLRPAVKTVKIDPIRIIRS